MEEDENVEQSEDSNEKTVGFEDDLVTVNPSDVAGTETNEEKKDSDADNEDVEGEPEDEPEEEIIVNGKSFSLIELLFTVMIFIPVYGG